MNKIKLLWKIFKYIFFFIILLITIFSIVLYLSKQNLYTESDFNIPKWYFDTKYQDKDIYSEDNWYEDYQKFMESFWKSYSIDLLSLDKDNGLYFDNYNHLKILWSKIDCIIYNKNKCEDSIYENYKNNEIIKIKIEYREDWLSLEEVDNIINSYKEEFFENKYKEDLQKSLILFNEFYETNKYYYDDIMKNEFFLYPIDYSSELNMKDYSIDYFRAVRYLSYSLIESWNIDMWVDIIIENQEFLDYLINKFDADIFPSLILLNNNNDNLLTIEYFINNYNLWKENLDKIRYYFKNNYIDENFLINPIKREYKIFEENILKLKKYWLWITDITSEILDNTKSYSNRTLIEKISNNLFFSAEETILLNYYIWYNFLDKNNGTDIFIKIKENLFNYKWISNYIWRKIISLNLYDNDYLFEKEERIHENRVNLIKNIEEKIEVLETQELTSSKSIKNNEDSLFNNINILQNDEKTYVEYDWNIIYEEKNDLDSFSPWYACDHFNYCISNWDVKPDIDLDEIQRELIKKIDINHLYWDIFLINRYYYEWWKSILFNTNTLEKKEIGLLYYKEIYKNAEKIILEQNTYWGTFILEINNNLDINNIFSPKDWPNVFTEFISYELLWDILKIEYYKSNSSWIREKKSYFYYLYTS